MAAALHLVGEKWSLLAVRELLWGNHRFDQLARNTGAPRDRLAARLRGLEAAGLVERRRYQERPARFEYHLTEAGRDLAWVLNALREWGDRWAVDESPVVFGHRCGAELDLVPVCRACGREVTPQEIRPLKGPPGWTRRGPVAVPQARDRTEPPGADLADRSAARPAGPGDERRGEPAVGRPDEERPEPDGR